MFKNSHSLVPVVKAVRRPFWMTVLNFNWWCIKVCSLSSFITGSFIIAHTEITQAENLEKYRSGGILKDDVRCFNTFPALDDLILLCELSLRSFFNGVGWPIYYTRLITCKSVAELNVPRGSFYDRVRNVPFVEKKVIKKRVDESHACSISYSPDDFEKVTPGKRPCLFSFLGCRGCQTGEDEPHKFISYQTPEFETFTKYNNSIVAKTKVRTHKGEYEAYLVVPSLDGNVKKFDFSYQTK
jgi:hypothetical protein